MSVSSRSNIGYTLIELMISLSLLTALVLSVFEVTQRSANAVRTGAVVTQLQADSERTLRRVVDRVQMTSSGRLTPRLASPLSSPRCEFQLPIGFDGSDVVWSTAQSLSFELDTLEVDDGIDNDGDGLVDEGRVIWTESAGDPNSRTVSWASGVRRYLEGEEPNNIDDNGNGLIDESGFAISVDDEIVTIWLTLERIETGDSTLIHTSRASVRLRN
ncbi:MAG: type II secretory pathway pseudopilin PulG [Planctomycetota bacterium]|jgi:type II secretory pathway pseudopilin PulG